MGWPPGNERTAGSRDWTTTMLLAANATAMGCPTTCGTLVSDDEPESIPLLQLFGMKGTDGATPASAEAGSEPVPPAAPVAKSWGGGAKTPPPTGRQGPC